ncbi:SH3 domain-containing protein [Pelagovum pacificum]|uniref:Uncharacterized protein n=1 Tax=Pelagovum pacificum TaxID=2588711 RepID=A0A5C5GKR7_9RHOB|nr:SH3 domain-containing protein [Pelagovum pacificum]QQA42825.1 SH3 domain-containing protein [Pelagovum pacificum]TNY34026.1 hypothetical protein FHY64_12410 [Pelagovum pacificum]
MFPRPLFLLFSLLLFPLQAMAEGRFSGAWEVVLNGSGPQIMWLELFDDGAGDVTGSGTTTDDFQPGGASSVSVLSGTTVGNSMQLVMRSDFSAGGSATVQLSAVESGGGLSGSIIHNGSFLPVTLVNRAAPSDPASCLELDAVTAELNASADTEMVQQIRGIYTINGLAFGGERTDAKCSAALIDLEEMVYSMNEPNPLAPVRVDPVTYDVSSWRPVAGGSGISLWNHNNSSMGWESGPGDRRVIWYYQPRSGLSGVGVRQGTLLFEGTRVGNRMEGRARIFTGACGPYSYYVEGPIASNNIEVTMTGQKPVVNDACQITGTAPDTLRFNYVADAPNSGPAEPSDEPMEGDVPGFGVWADRFAVQRVASNDTLNVRTGPGTGYAVVGELPPTAQGILVEAGGCTPEMDQIAYDQANRAQRTQMISTRWCDVSWGSLRGWVYAGYLRSSD